MERSSDDFFKNINFDKAWDEEDWEKFFLAQERLLKQQPRVGHRPERPGVDPALSFSGVLRRFGMDPDNPHTPPQPFYFTEAPTEESHAPPGLKFWQEGADFESLPIYCQARCHAYRVQMVMEARFREVLIKTYKSVAHQDFQRALITWDRHVQQVPRLLAAAHGLGYDPMGVKGNVVQCRRALENIDAAVGTLSKMSVRFWGRSEHQKFMQETLRLRNALHRWIDLLRTRFVARRPPRHP